MKSNYKRPVFPGIDLKSLNLQMYWPLHFFHTASRGIVQVKHLRGDRVEAVVEFIYTFVEFNNSIILNNRFAVLLILLKHGLKGHSTDFFITHPESFWLAESEIDFFIMTILDPPPGGRKFQKPRL